MELLLEYLEIMENSMQLRAEIKRIKADDLRSSIKRGNIYEGSFRLSRKQPREGKPKKLAIARGRLQRTSYRCEASSAKELWITLSWFESMRGRNQIL